MPVKRARSGLYVQTAPGRSMRRNFRKRVTKRKYSRAKRGRVLPNYTFHRWVTTLGGINVTDCTYATDTSVLTVTTTKTEPAFSLSFSLDDLPNKTEFTTLFDQYMITGVMLQIKMIPVPESSGPLNVDPTSATTYYNNNVNWYPTIWYTPDHDDTTNLTLAQIKEYERVRHKVLSPRRETTIMLRPTILTQLYRTSVTTGYGVSGRRFIDMGQTNVPHYGFKCVIDMEGQPPRRDFTFKINAKYYFRCKNVR